MEGLGQRLRNRARTLGLSDSEIARRLGLSQARYHNYVSDTAEPDLGTLVRICRILGSSPDEILDFSGETESRTDADLGRERITSAAAALGGDILDYTADLMEAMVTIQRKRRAGPAGRRVSGLKKPD